MGKERRGGGVNVTDRLLGHRELKERKGFDSLIGCLGFTFSVYFFCLCFTEKRCDFCLSVMRKCGGGESICLPLQQSYEFSRERERKLFSLSEFAVQIESLERENLDRVRKTRRVRTKDAREKSFNDEKNRTDPFVCQTRTDPPPRVAFEFIDAVYLVLFFIVSNPFYLFCIYLILSCFTYFIYCYFL